MWTICTWTAWIKSYWPGPIFVSFQWSTNFNIIVEFISFILDFLCFFYKRFAKVLLCKSSIPSQRREISGWWEKWSWCWFFSMRREQLASSECPQRWIKLAAFSASTSISLRTTSTVSRSPSANPISRSADAPTCAFQWLEKNWKDFFFYLIGRNI